MRLLEDAALRTQRVLADPAPAAKLARFGADGLEFQLLYWIDDPQNGQLNVRSDVNVRALQALREANIDIPFPQRVVHLRTEPAAIAPSASGTEETG
jgi:small-conductance mechanosensitive channel